MKWFFLIILLSTAVLATDPQVYEDNPTSWGSRSDEKTEVKEVSPPKESAPVEASVWKKSKKTKKESFTQPTSCMESWQCTDWTTCNDGFKVRYCHDKNQCNTINNAPQIVEFCGERMGPQQTSFLGMFSFILSFIALSGMGIFVVAKFKRPDEAVQYVRSLRSKGYSENAIRNAFLMHGYKEADVQKIMKKL